MSGGVGPASDITLPKEEVEHHEPHATTTTTSKKPPVRRRFITFRQLNALAVVIVLSASGMVSLEDFAFVTFSIFYMYFISKVAFPAPATSPHSEEAQLFGEKNRLLTAYVFVGALIGLFLPIAYIFEGIFEGDKEGIKAAAPHVFLLASQIFMEGVSYWAGFSLPIRVFVPVVYNAMRIFSVMEWVRSEVVKEDAGYSERRLHVGRALAVANMAYWGFNLFGFLLPFYLPKAFKIYYSAADSKVNKD